MNDDVITVRVVDLMYALLQAYGTGFVEQTLEIEPPLFGKDKAVVARAETWITEYNRLLEKHARRKRKDGSQRIPLLMDAVTDESIHSDYLDERRRHLQATSTASSSPL